MLRKQKEEVERRLIMSEQENRALLRRIKDLEDNVSMLNRKASLTLDGLDTSTFGRVPHD